MALAARLSADHNLHASLRPHRDPRLLVGRADRGFDIARKSASEQLSPFCRRAAALFETAPLGDGHRPIHILLVAPAVVDHTHCVAVRHRFRANEVLAPQLDAIDAELLRRRINKPFDREGHLRPPGAAIGICGHGIGEDRHGAQRSVGNKVWSHDQARSLGQRRKGNAVAAHIADIGRAHREEATLAGERELDSGDQVASLIVGEKRLVSRRGELDRTAELARRPQHERKLDEDAVAGAEITADIVGQDAHAFGRDAEHGRNLALLPHCTAAAGVKRIAPARTVVLSERSARLERHAGHTLDMEVHRQDVVGTRECLVSRLPIAEQSVDQNVVRHLAPKRRRARPQRVFGMVDPRRDFVIDFDALHGIERLRHALAHDHGDGLADMANALCGQQHVWADEDRTAAGSMQLHVVLGLRQWIVGNGRKPVGKAVGAGEHAEHARHRLGLHGVDAEDARVCVRGAQHYRVGLAVYAEIVAEEAVPGDEPLVLLASDRLADRAESRVGRRGFLIEVRHRGWSAQRLGKTELVAVRVGQMEEALAPFGIARRGVRTVAGRDHAGVQRIDVGMVEDDTPPPGPVSFSGLGDEVEIAHSRPKAGERGVPSTVKHLEAQHAIETHCARHVVSGERNRTDAFNHPPAIQSLQHLAISRFWRRWPRADDGRRRACCAGARN